MVLILFAYYLAMSIGRGVTSRHRTILDHQARRTILYTTSPLRNPSRLLFTLVLQRSGGKF